MGKGKARILVIDDELEITRALQRGLTAHGYDVTIAHSGAKLSQTRPIHVSCKQSLVLATAFKTMMMSNKRRTAGF